MPLAGWFTLAGTLVIVALLAIYLIRIAFILNHVNFTLGTIIAGLHSIAMAGEPLEPLIGDIYAHLEETRIALDQTLGVEG